MKYSSVVLRVPLALLWFLLLATDSGAQQASSPKAIEQYNQAARWQKLEEFDVAAKEWEKLVADHPKDPLAAAAQHYAGVCRFQLGEYPAAIKSFEAFLAASPKHELTEATLTNLGLAAYNQAQRSEGDASTKLYQQAVTTFDQLAKQFPESKLGSQSDFYRGESLYALGKLAEAEQAYNQWLKDYVDEKSQLEPSVRLALGATQTELGKTDAARKTLESLLGDNPPNDIAAQASVRLGDALVAAGEHAAAAQQYANATTIDPNTPDADYAAQARVSALFNAGDYTAAAQVYEELGDIASAGKALYQAGDYTAAAERLAKAYAAAPNDAELAHWWSRSLLQAGQPAEALKAADTALTKTKSAELLLDKADAMYAIDAQRAASLPAYIAAADAAEGELAAEARHLAAATALELGELDTAKQQAQSILDKHADTSFVPDARLTLAEAQLQSGEAQQAAATFAELLKTATDEQKPDWTVRLAWAQSTAGDEAAVVATLQPLAVDAKSSTGQQAAFLLGRALFRTGDAAAAAKTLRAVAEANPPSDWSPEAKLILGRSLTATGDQSGAIASLTALIDSQPSAQLAAQAYYRRGEAQQSGGDAKAAVADYDHVLANSPQHPLAPYAAYRAAMLQMQQREFDDAAARFGKLADTFPDHTLAGEARLGQSTSLAQSGNNAEAAAVLQKMDTSEPRVALALGTSLAGQKKWDEAIKLLKQAAEAPGEFVDRDRAWYELGWAYRESGQQEDSRGAFHKLIKQLPDSPLAADAMFRVAELSYEAEDYQQAAGQFRAAAKQAANDATLNEKALHMAGWAQHKSGDGEAAAATFAEQLKAHPSGALAPDGQWMIGEARFAAEQYDQALAAYGKAKDAKPSSATLAPLGMLHAGQAAAQLEKWQESADWLKAASTDYPDYDGQSEIAYELGWSLMKLGKPDEAKPILEKVADRDTSPIGARARFVLGEIEFGNKEYEQAVRTFFKVAYGYGDREAPEAYHHWQAESLFEAARCLEQLDRGSAAKKLYQELVQRFPKEAKAELAQKRLATLGN